MSSANIFVITGPSGVGKGTLCKALLDSQPRLRLSISATSRSKREGEKEGINYFFKTRAEFETMIAHDRAESDPSKHLLLEWAEYNGNYYGTPRAAVEQALAVDRHVLLEIDAQGALMVKEKFPAAHLIFIAPPDMEELERRLRGRGTDAEADIQSRLQISRQEMALRDRFDVVVVNNQLDACLEILQNITK